jgi:hypothetical protein
MEKYSDPFNWLFTERFETDYLPHETIMDTDPVSLEDGKIIYTTSGTEVGSRILFAYQGQVLSAIETSREYLYSSVKILEFRGTEFYSINAIIKYLKNTKNANNKY